MEIIIVVTVSSTAVVPVDEASVKSEVESRVEAGGKLDGGNKGGTLTGIVASERESAILKCLDKKQFSNL